MYFITKQIIQQTLDKMAKRVAFFASKKEVEEYYNIQTNKQALFEPHYNLSPGHQLPVIILNNGEPEITRVRWGQMGANSAEQTTTEEEKVLDELKKNHVKRCILSLSGFFVWKDDEEKNHPFFIRLLNNAVMSVAGLYYEGHESFVSIITTEANALVEPMSSTMPMMLDRPTALQWLDPGIDLEELLKEAGNLFMLTDLSVLRVSKKVNDPTNNSPEIIQPIPK